VYEKEVRISEKNART